jgi:hypothetical protein
MYEPRRFTLTLLVAVMAICATALVACGGDDDDAEEDPTATRSPAGTAAITLTADETPAETGTPGETGTPAADATGTIVPTPASTPLPCPVEETVCGSARALETLLRDDVAAVVAGAEPVTVTCDATPAAGIDVNAAVCEGASPGEMRTGYRVAAWQSEGSILPEGELLDYLQQWVDQGPLELAAVGCPTGSNGFAHCADVFAVVFTPPGGETLFEIIMSRFTVPVPRPTAFITGNIELNQPVVDGGVHELALPFVDLDGGTTTYHSYRTQ